MLSIAYSEFVQIFRNTLVLASALLVPIGLSALFIAQRDTFAAIDAGMGFVASLLLAPIVALGLYAASVTTLAARRQDLFMKRLRSTTASDAGILSGLVAPQLVITIVQAAVLLGILGLVGGAPADVPMLVVAGVCLVLLMLGLALATAGLTQSPGHAQVTTLPVIFGVIALALWIGLAGTAEFTEVKRLLPGGAIIELTINAWNGGAELGHNLMLLLPTLGWIVIAFILAKVLFRWEPRN